MMYNEPTFLHLHSEILPVKDVTEIEIYHILSWIVSCDDRLCLCLAACLDIRYIPKDIAVALDFTLNGKIVFTEEVSGMYAGYAQVVVLCGLS